MSFQALNYSIEACRFLRWFSTRLFICFHWSGFGWPCSIYCASSFQATDSMNGMKFRIPFTFWYMCLSAYKWYLFSFSQFWQQFKIRVTIVALHSSVLKNSTGLSISTSSPATQHLRDSGGESQCPLWNAFISHFVEAQLLILKSLPKSPEIPSKAFYWLCRQYFSEEFLLNPPSHLFCTLHLWQLPKTGWAVLIT